MTKTPKEKVSITLDADLVSHIHKLAEEDDRTFSQYINTALKRYLAYSDKLHLPRQKEK